MLVLARQLHQRLVIPVIDTAIEVVAVRSGSVRLGIEAPPDVAILREELWLRGSKPSTRKATHQASGEHTLRSRLHNLLLGLDVLRRQAGEALGPDLAITVNHLMHQADAAITALDSLLSEAPIEKPPVSAACSAADEEPLGSSA